MRKTKKNRAMAVLLALVMALTTVTAAFAVSAYDYYVPKKIEPPQSLEDAERYHQERVAEDYREGLYRNTSDEASLLPTDLKPTPLPEELNIDPETYWKEISLDGDTDDATTRSTEKLYQEICQLVDELTKGLSTPSEKYATIKNWVDDNVKYSLDNRTDNVYLVYERRYGACTEQSGLLYLMATIAGIKAAILRSPGVHQGTAILEENGGWIGDDFKISLSKSHPTKAFYIDGTTKYKMDFTTGELTNMGEIKVPDKQPEPDPVPDANFSDVPASAWYAGAVNWAVAKGITNGTSATTFSPAKTCTQGEIIVFLYRAAGSPKADADMPFTIKNAWATDALKWAYSKDIIYSIDENAPCTRATAVYYIWKAFGSHAAQSANKFTDLGGYENYKRAISWAVENGIVAGTSPTTFSPGLTCDRATIVTLLQRAFSK